MLPDPGDRRNRRGQPAIGAAPGCYAEWGSSWKSLSNFSRFADFRQERKNLAKQSSQHGLSERKIALSDLFFLVERRGCIHGRFDLTTEGLAGPNKSSGS